MTNNIVFSDKYSVISNMIEYKDIYYAYYYNIITNKYYINEVNNFNNYPLLNSDNLSIIEDEDLFNYLKEVFNV